ncbi:SDR family NAD(P)-dependent oxidoreductase [Salinimonas sediminis]|uniref:SDR family oxidoreductase n=1 Tax=Salinimonas sediminis TaxID=2303538 RepID=A0A346NRT1_9ALTE|nr:SDR family NAD(P)-dependent oxidoreductase [Salinimonas sediminis]AXR08238.1 SDR family oxidoreductase [Salinimonas sediminis]
MILQDRVIIVAGGGRDIGAACAYDIAKKGAKVLITYHASAEGANKVVDNIKQSGGQAEAIQADLTNPQQVASCVAQTLELFNKIDGLVHVAGGLIARKKITEMSLEHWRHVMDVNMTSLFLMSQAVIPHLSNKGSIVTFASQAGRDGGGGAVPYASSKGAIMTFTRGLAKELGPDIRVNSVCPGMISTGFHDTFTPDEVRKNVAQATVLKREGEASEVASLVSFLLSDEASYITGANIDINGGLVFS